MGNEFPIEMHASQETLQICGVSGNGPVLQNLDFCRIYMKSGLINHNRSLSKEWLLHLGLQPVLAKEVQNCANMLKFI
jgi:hypothetical protein